MIDFQKLVFEKFNDWFLTASMIAVFDVIDLLTSSLLLPLGGLLLAVLAGWVMTRDNAKDELDAGNHIFDIWHEYWFSNCIGNFCHCDDFCHFERNRVWLI